MRRAVLILCALGLSASEAPSNFPEAFNGWANLANVRATKPGTVDAGEYMAWQRVKSEFRKLQREMDRFYEGR